MSQKSSELILSNLTPTKPAFSSIFSGLNILLETAHLFYASAMKLENLFFR
jgi:hypothetical protein